MSDALVKARKYATYFRVLQIRQLLSLDPETNAMLFGVVRFICLFPSNKMCIRYLILDTF